MVFPSTPGVSVRVLRPMFVTGCGGTHEFASSVTFSRSPPTVIPLPSRSVSHLLSPRSIARVDSSLSGLLPLFPSFLLVSPYSSSLLPILAFLLPCLSPISPPSFPPWEEGPMGALWFVCWTAYQHHRRHHWNLSLSLCSPSPSLLFFPLLCFSFFLLSF